MQQLSLFGEPKLEPTIESMLEYCNYKYPELKFKMFKEDTIFYFLPKDVIKQTKTKNAELKFYIAYKKNQYDTEMWSKPNDYFIGFSTDNSTEGQSSPANSVEEFAELLPVFVKKFYKLESEEQ